MYRNIKALYCEPRNYRVLQIWCWEGLGAGGEGDDRGWDGWMASPTQWTWVWVNSGSWWWTGRPGVLGFMGSQRVRHDWATELNWTGQLYFKTNRKRDHICGYQKKGVLNEGGKEVQTPIYKTDTRAAKYNIINISYTVVCYIWKLLRE